jgi:predicted metalloendopeptidase
VISQYYNNSLAMPDRDYYLKDDARFKEARAKYVAYMQRLFTLAGSNEAQAKAAATPCCAWRSSTRLRRSITSSCAIRRRPITR